MYVTCSTYVWAFCFPSRRLPVLIPYHFKSPATCAWNAGRAGSAWARKVSEWTRRCKLPYDSCGNTAIKGWSWPNFWANLASFSL